jgi:hypothetical protein
VLLDLTDGAFAESARRPWRDRVEVAIAGSSHAPAGAVLIRPDGYVAWAADEAGSADINRLHCAISRWFGAPGPAQREMYSGNRHA